MSAGRIFFLSGLLLSACGLFLSLPSGAYAEEQQKAKSGSQTGETQAEPSAPQTPNPPPIDEIPEGPELPEMPETGTPSDPAAGAAVSESLPGWPNYVLGPEDVLEVDVFNVPELKKTVRVSNDGTIGLALIGRVQAAGLTVDQLRELLEAKYGETYLQDPQIAVFVTEYKAQSVSVIGAVERPGIYHLTAPRTLIEVLSMAGGLAKKTSAPAGRTLILTRKGGFGDLASAEGMRFLAPDKLEIEIRKLLYSQDSTVNIEVKPFDTISVAKADLIYVVGDVRRPTGILMEDRDDLTVLQALAMAEGLNRTAARKSARIFRRDETGNRMEIPVNLKNILDGKAPDLALMANDVLFVPDSRSKVMLQRGFEASIATISGVIIWRGR